MDPPALVILALATWRVSHMVARELGPFQCFQRLRFLLGARYDVATRTWKGSATLSQLVVCPLCLSVWVAIVFVALWTQVPASQVVWVVLAVSGLASAIELLLTR